MKEMTTSLGKELQVYYRAPASLLQFKAWPLLAEEIEELVNEILARGKYPVVQVGSAKASWYKSLEMQSVARTHFAIVGERPDLPEPPLVKPVIESQAGK